MAVLDNYRMEEVLHDLRIPAQILLQNLPSEDTYVSPHWHRHIEINLVLRGNVEFVIDGQKRIVEAGELCIINSGVIHSGRDTGKKEKIELITILWEYEFFLKYCKDLPMYRFVIEESGEIFKKIRDMIIQIGILYRAQSPFYEMKVSAILLELGSTLLQYCLEKDQVYTEYEKTKTLKKVQDSIEYIEEYYMEDLSLQNVSEHMHMSPTYFSKKFKYLTGINFYKFLIQCRLKHARDDLLNTDLSMTEIAFHNGFPNVKSFIEQFKKQYEKTPKQYKKAYVVIK